MFFGSRNNLIKPGPSRSMADGWETRRRRGPGHDWAIVRLAARGHDRAARDRHLALQGQRAGAVHGRGRRAGGDGELDGWRTLLASPLQPHTRHVFDERAAPRRRRHAPAAVSVYPCGGVARLRAWGTLGARRRRPGSQRSTRCPAPTRSRALQRCCGSTSVGRRRWPRARPFEDVAALLRIAERTWWSLGEADHLEAFAAHPRIGETKVAGDRRREVVDAASRPPPRRRRADARRARRGEPRVRGASSASSSSCARSGRSADAMLADLRARLANSARVELRTAAEEQAKITRLRLAS